MQQVFVQYVEIEHFRMNVLLLTINDNIAVTEVKCWVTESVFRYVFSLHDLSFIH
jgi:hypothetical protein